MMPDFPKYQTLFYTNESDNPNLEYKHSGDSGFDLRAFITEEDGGKERSVTMKPLERKMFHTGLRFKVPNGCEVQVRPRSGCAIKQGLTVINTPGTVDVGYTGEICILAVNLSDSDITVTNGDRIAQAVLCPVYSEPYTTLSKVDEYIWDTERGANGFNSTGIK